MLTALKRYSVFWRFDRPSFSTSRHWEPCIFYGELSEIMAVCSNSIGCTLYNRVIYHPASWIADNLNVDIIPKTKINLFNGPTPIHQFKIPGLEDSGLSCFIKRDDLTSFDMSGNKVRKLEFLMAEALGAESYDSVITIGGLQSNHARATAVASRQLGLDPYLILRTKEQPEDVDLVGNLLFNRCKVIFAMGLSSV